jgi:hypothetical protein
VWHSIIRAAEHGTVFYQHRATHTHAPHWHPPPPFPLPNLSRNRLEKPVEFAPRWRFLHNFGEKQVDRLKKGHRHHHHRIRQENGDAISFSGEIGGRRAGERANKKKKGGSPTLSDTV